MRYGEQGSILRIPSQTGVDYGDPRYGMNTFQLHLQSRDSAELAIVLDVRMRVHSRCPIDHTLLAGSSGTTSTEFKSV